MTAQRPIEERIARFMAEAAPDDVPHRVLEAAFETTRSMPQDRVLPRGLGEWLPRWTHGRLLVPAVVLLLVALLAALAVGAPLLLRLATPDLRSSVLERGVLTVAVRADHPQAVIESEGLTGFDLDVAQELALRLGVRAEIVTVTRDELAAGAGDGAWDLALGSIPADAVDPARVAAGPPYYAWPRYLLVPSGSPVAGPDELAGSVVCAVTGDPGADWAASAIPGAAATLITRPTDDDCLPELTAGTAAAVVTSTLGPADLAVRSQVRSIGGPPHEVRVVAAHRADRPESLLDDVERLLLDMARDGTLASLSERRFGGFDLSTPIVQGG